MAQTTLPDQAFAKESSEIIDQLQADTQQGLSSSEASERLEQYGPNRMEEKKEKPLYKLLIQQFTTSVMYLLAAAAILSFAFGDIPEGIAIVVVMLVNAGIGFGMEYQARRSMKALREMDKIDTLVLRDGEEQTLDAEKLVPGDIVLLRPGDVVPADLRVLEVKELQINEAPLTGESLPVQKEVDPLAEDTTTADRINMAFKGTSVTHGKGKGLVVATGMDTEIGNVSAMMSSAETEEIPLNRKLNKLSQRLIYLVLIMAGLLGIIGWAIGKDLYQIIQTSIAWAIAAIPEGLPIVASIALARGMLRLARHNVIVKRLASVETLGETNTILTDKTGTLTENRLTVKRFNLSDGQDGQAQWKNEQVELENIDRESDTFQKLFAVCVLANEASYQPDAEEESEGDALEIALLRFASYLNAEERAQLEDLEKIGEDPFDTGDNMMGTVYKKDGQYFVSAKGAAESILEVCSHKLVEGKAEAFSEEDKQAFLEKDDTLANDGLRPLAFAYWEDQNKPAGVEEQDFLEGLTFIGLIGFIDPPAEDVPDVIETYKTAGIEVVMVTGDHPGTAITIGEEVGLTDKEEDHAIHGKEIANEEVEEKDMAKAHVFARVDPGQKLELVEHFQNQNKVVGMTGDGVNDAPALKKADIGIAMGIKGTQAAKEAADIVLKDDNFSSIENAIREGRIIFGNIRKFIIYQLSYHFSEVLVIAVVMLVLFKLALKPLQLLYLNILLDVFPALALGVGSGRAGVMKAPPKDPEEDIITPRNWTAITVYGCIIAAAVCGVYFYGYYQLGFSIDIANNVAFFSLAFTQLFNVLNMRDADENVFVNQVTRNKYVWMALALCAAALIAAYFVPGLSDLLQIKAMPASAWWLIGIGTIVPALIIQGVKQLVKS